MADPTTDTTATTPAPAPATASAPASAPAAAPPVMPAPSAPDLSTLVQPGALATAPSLEGTTEYIGYQKATAAQAAAAQKAADLANAPTAQPYQGPHARLLAMVSGLATGLSAFGTSLGTHGKEGGAAEVEQIQAQEQQQKIAAQEATQAQRNAQINQQITIGETNRALAQSYLNLLSLPDEITANHLKVQLEQQGLEAGTQGLQIQMADFMKQNWGFTPAEITGGQSGQPGAAADPAHISNAQTMLNRAVGDPKDPNTTGAIAILGKDNPAVQAALTAATDPKATVQSILAAGQGLNVALQQKSAVTEAQNQAAAGLPKNQQEAAAQLAAAESSGDAARIAKAQAVKASIDKAVQDERQFSSNLQAQNNAANRELSLSNTLAQKGVEDTNKLWTDPQHGFAQTRAQVQATKDVVAQAKNGSELAASLEPAMAVLGVNSFAGVHRISPTEYEAAGPAVGSLYRRLNALLDKAGKGAVPAATLSEVDGIMDALLRNKYQTSLDSTRQITANAGIPANRISVPDPNNFGALTTLDKIPVISTPAAPAGFVTVQIPGQPVGHIPQSALPQFRKDHPNAVVTQ